MDENKELAVSLKDLPFKATVKYLGCQHARGLWGMKHTRKPVDNLVAQAKTLQEANTILPIVKLEVNLQGLSFREVTNKKDKNQPSTSFSIDSISYGVQDLVYTRVFSIIFVRDVDIRQESPFMCHSFVCDSRTQARNITYALAAAFQEYGKQAKIDEENGKKPKKFAIDLRSPEEQAAAEQSDEETEA